MDVLCNRRAAYEEAAPIFLQLKYFSIYHVDYKDSFT